MIPNHIPFELSGPVSVFGSFYGNLAQQQRAIAAVQSSTVIVAQLSEISSDLGEVRAGSFITENLYYSVDNATGYHAFSGYGVIIAGQAFTLDGTDYWNIAGFSDASPSTLQFALSATTGAAYAGAGAVTLDASGLRILGNNLATSRIMWYGNSPNFDAGGILYQISGSTANRTSLMNVFATPEGSGGGSVVYITAYNSAQTAQTNIGVSDVNIGPPYLSYLDPYGNNGTLHYGDVQDAFQATLTTTPSTVFTRSIEANSISTKGYLHTQISANYLNNSGANRGVTWTYNFGALAFSIASAGNIGAHATSESSWLLDIFTWADQATNAQRHLMILKHTGTLAAGTSGTPVLLEAWNTSAIDTTADVAVTVTVVSSADTATQTIRGVSTQDGPYYNL